MILSELRERLAALHPSAESANVEVTDGDAIYTEILDVVYEGGVVTVRVAYVPQEVSIGDANDFHDED